MTTAKESIDARRSSPSSILVDSSEELENIAKQISDHAEAIYQEWKSRGLAPTEILKCHAGSDKTYDTLIPKSSKQSFSTTTLLDDDVQLVNNFVHQDKARIASQKTKFSPSVANANNSSSSTVEQTSRTLSAITEKEKKKDDSSSLNYVPDVLKDTIEKYAKLHTKPEAPVKPDYLLNHIPQCPFKKKMSSYDDEITNEDKNVEKFFKKQNRHPRLSADVMKEVTLQEEKLINALRTDTVLSTDSVNKIERKIKDELYTNSLSIRNFDENDCSLAQPQLPQKPNHTPMYVLSRDEAPKR